jgi:hypothetical protein
MIGATETSFICCCFVFVFSFALLRIELRASYLMCKCSNHLSHAPSSTTETLKIMTQVKHQWLMPVILVTQEAEIKRITIQNKPGHIVQETLS